MEFGDCLRDNGVMNFSVLSIAAVFLGIIIFGIGIFLIEKRKATKIRPPDGNKK